ncbi:aspartyl protease family protein [Kaarinaea lacus]
MIIKQWLKRLALLLCLQGPLVLASEYSHVIPMHDKGAEAYYVNGNIAGLVDSEFMVDTGSGYVVINEQSLVQLLAKGEVKYHKDIRGILADGSEKKVSVWMVSELNIGGVCALKNVEVAVFPGRTRQILGLRALKQAAPFSLSFDPPRLQLSHCLQEQG